jgi:NADH-quinone oxidoreductase subunit N
MTEAIQLYPVLPELLLAGGAMVLLLIGAYDGERSAGPALIYAVGLLALAGIVIYGMPGKHQEAFNGSFVVDGFGRYLKILTVIGSIGTLWLSWDFLSQPGRSKFEYPVLILLSTTGMLLLISANDLIALYLGLELMSLALYVVASFDRDNVRSTEAGLKYFVLGALSSGMLLYGASLIYGFTGTVKFAGIAAAAAGGGIGVIVGLVLLFAGLCFKVSAVPFHMWTPDVYEGAPTPVTAFFASAPKVAAIAVFMRVCVSAFPKVAVQWQQVIVFVAIASMLLGAFAAIGQRNIKRLMAYSSIGHMGFALVGLAAAAVLPDAGLPQGGKEGIQGVLIYMAVYVAMTLGVFACIIAMRRNGKPFEDIADLSGLARTNPAMALTLAILMFSLAGVPPLAGFFAKFFVFAAAVKAKMFTLAVLGVLASVVSCYYYLLIVKVMYFDDPAPAFDPMGNAVRAMLVVAGGFVVLFVFFAGPLVAAAGAAANSLF